MAVSTVQARTKKLESEGILKGYTAVLDYDKLGLTVTAIIEITTVGGRPQEVESKLSQMPQASAVYDVAGTTDAIVIGKFRSTYEISKFAKAIQGIPNVNRTETHIVFTVVKEQLPNSSCSLQPRTNSITGKGNQRTYLSQMSKRTEDH